MNRYFFILIIIIATSCNNSDSSKFLISDNSMEGTINIGATVSYRSAENINQDDIIAFNNPTTNKPSCLRVVGMPGEKIEIIKGVILINNKEYVLPKSSKMVYTVYSKKSNDFSKLVNYSFKKYSDNYGMVAITKKQFDEISTNKLVDSIYLLGFDSSYIYPQILKVSTSKKFNHYYFGPVIIPKVGDTVIGSDKMLVSNFLNFTGEYLVVKEPCYFCIGDSFSDATDSRVIGLIPKNKILGIVKHINNTDVVRITSNQ
jgi:signal peptidase I